MDVIDQPESNFEEDEEDDVITTKNPSKSLNTSKQPESCVLIGSTTLAIYCAEKIRSIGFEIRSVVCTDDVFKNWAIGEAVNRLDSVESLEAELAEGSIDWLFSVVNPFILSTNVIERVRKGAFNYHDSPLPRYAGTNATSWALIAQETDYAVSWHTLTAAVDAGQIAVQESVPIDSYDTALSLNLKCYQAARKSLDKLLDQLVNNNLKTRGQDASKRSFYRRNRKPNAGGYLDWTQSAEVLSAIIRALDFGPLYPNPLTRGKLNLGSETIQIGQVQILQHQSNQTPGTVITINQESWYVATKSKDLLIRDFADLEGNQIDPEVLADEFGYRPGIQLPMLTVEDSRRIKQTLESLVNSESFWYDRLTRVVAIQLPYEKIPESVTPQWIKSSWCEPIEHFTNQRLTVLGLFVIYLSRLTGQSRLQFGWKCLSKYELPEAKILATTVPMECEIEPSSPLEKNIKLIEEEIRRLDESKTYPRDLVCRYPALRAISALKTTKPWRIAFSLVDSPENEEPVGSLLTLQIDTYGRFRWIYDSRCFETDSINRMEDHLREIARSAAADIHKPIGQFNMLSQAERELLINTWNDTQLPYPSEASVHQLFELRVNRDPNATAVVYKDQRISYAQLNSRANQVACRLLELNLGPGDFVATLHEHSIDLIIAQLAILKTGAAYVPLDPTAPFDRHRWIINDCSAQLLITNLKANFDIPVLRMTNEDFMENAIHNPNTASSSLDIAYVMYTSGSTGAPKGVLVPHRGIVRLVINNGYAEIGPNDRVAFAANPAFDASTFEVWGPLLNGGRVVVIDRETLLNGQSFCETLEVERVNVLWMTVCFFKEFATRMTKLYPQLDLLIVGGDLLDVRSINQTIADNPPKRFINVYGVTESTTFATSFTINGIADGIVPIGRPIGNTRIYLLDGHLQPVPRGATGEIYIGGDGVARGYLNRPDLTIKRFLPDPYVEDPNARMYKTGDLARYLPDGNLVFLGRDDYQVKIRGFRIEPGEIEAKLMQHPSVRQAVVISVGETEKRLVAYVVVGEKVSAKDLSEYLLQRLPDYMIPAAFVQLDALPLTRNGKLDRQALPVQNDDSFARATYQEPVGPLETTLAEIWCTLLGVSRISRHDSFFALGGHSLLGVRLCSRMAALGIDLPLVTLFACPTLASLAEAIQAKRDASVRPPITVTPRYGSLIPSFAQQRLWFLSHFIGVSEAYHVPFGLHLKGSLNVSALQKALDTVWTRHEALRTFFISNNGQPEVGLLVAERGIPLRRTDLRRANGISGICEQIVKYPFDLANGPLIRADLIRIEEDSHVLLLTQHHIISDGWSLNVLLRELRTLYTAFQNQLPDPLPALKIQYPDFAVWQRHWLRGERLEAQCDYWKTALMDAPIRLDLPTDRDRPVQQSYAGDRVLIDIDTELTLLLKFQSQQHNATLFTTLLAAWAAVLSRLSGQNEIVIGAPCANRSQHEIESLIGFFVNTLAFRIDLRGQPNVGQLLSRVRETVVQAQAHQDIPFEQVVEALQPPRRLDYTPIFQVIFAWQEANEEKEEWPGLSVGPFQPDYKVAKFDLELDLMESNDRIVGALGYCTALFDRSTVERHVKYLKTLLKAMIVNTCCPVDKMDILDSTEREVLLEKWNETEIPYPAELLVHQRFEEQVVQSPNATAISYVDQQLSYEQLNTRANRLAHLMAKLGVIPGDYVVTLLERSPELVVAQLAIYKAGAIYVPLDPQNPFERLAWTIKNCSARLLITITGVTKFDVATINLNKVDLREVPSSNPALSGSSLDVAYVMYTSGSTGTPKGVLITHTSIMRLVVNNGFAKIGPDDRMAFFSNPAFDASTLDVWWPLANGATLVILNRETVLDPAILHRTLRKERINFLLITAGHLRHIVATLPDTFSELDALLVGADVLHPRSINTVLATAPPKLLINTYGPTETTTIATTFHISEAVNEQASIPIGRPISNTRIYVLDPYGQPVPLGAVGEVYIGGAGVARGYLNREDLTKEYFLPDTFAKDPKALMYKTGDLARYLPNGNLIFLGRRDFQVKIRGFRIELAEVEAKLAEHPAVHRSVVVARGDHDKRLTAYVVADDTNPGQLREYLRLYLPDYMVPDAFVKLEALPLKPSGKVDFRALPMPDGNSFAHASYEAPLGDLEVALSEIWCDLLGVERVGRHDSFFALGGHSLLALRLISRIASLGVELSVSSLFASPTLAALAAEIESQRDSGVPTLPRIVTINRDGPLPLSFAQQRLWFLSQHGGASEAYHIPLALVIKGHLNVRVWRRALDTLWIRHESLRSVFISVDGQPEVRFLDAGPGFPFSLRNVLNESEATALRAKEAQSSFDLTKGPLVRAVLFRLADNLNIFSLTLHHIISDGWSNGVLIRELNSLYSAYRDNRPDPLQPLEIQYTDYSAWQREWFVGERRNEQKAFWKAALTNAPVQLDLLSDFPRPAEQSFVGRSVPIVLDAELTSQLKQLSRQQDVTLFMIALAAWGALLSRMSGQVEVVVGVPCANRRHSEVESLIGFFVNTLAMRVDFRGHPCVAKLLERVKNTAVQAQAHQDLPFEEVVDCVNPPRRLDSTPIFQVMLAWENNEKEDLVWPGLDVGTVEPIYDVVKFDLELDLSEMDDRIVGSIRYATALFNHDTIQRQAEYLKLLLRGMVANSATDTPVDKIDILDSSERELLIAKWNGTKVPYSDQACVHQLFERQAKLAPNATAIFFEGTTISYAQLNERANEIAHRLMEIETEPEAKVAICAERSPMMIAAFLGIWKAGLAYVPLDPTYHGKRIAHILEDCNPSVVLADRNGRVGLDEYTLDTRLIIDPNDIKGYPKSDPVGSKLSSRNLAYVIYTSGTTGKPKGVMVEHRSLVNLAEDEIRRYDVNCSSRILQFASFCFDASVFDILMAFTSGSSLYVLSDTERWDQRRFMDYLKSHAITHVTLPSVLLQAWNDGLKETSSLTYIFEGETIKATWLQGLVTKNRVFCGYGLTEGTVCSTIWPYQADYNGRAAPIGRPISNTRIYILDVYRRLVPIGVVGEIYVGGDSVARGYLSSNELTIRSFIPDPFVDDHDARMYKTGDLAYWLPDGNLMFLGRNDEQIKIRGIRIEPGEIEILLIEHPSVREALVIAKEEPNAHLIAYVVADTLQPASLREHLSAKLPETMIPSAFIRLDAFPLTNNGKVDRRALPTPDANALPSAYYEEPIGPTETILADIWQKLLQVERISRHDSFFALGGHSLLAVQMIERLRCFKLKLTVRDLFQTPVLKALARTLDHHSAVPIPPNLITRQTDKITPEMLPLIDLNQDDIDRIIKRVPHGITNIQDIYGLAPLQEGLLFHHLLDKHVDPYVTLNWMAFASRATISRYLEAVQRVVDRHDTLRTAFIWEGQSAPAQVVWRQAPLSITELTLNPTNGPITDQLFERFKPSRYRIDLTQAPLLRFVITRDDTNDRWILLTLFHHLMGDHTTLAMMHDEVQSFLENRQVPLPPVVPFRNLIAHTRSGLSNQSHERFFKAMLAEVTEPTLPFDLANVHQDGTRISETHRKLSCELNDKLRAQAKRTDVSLASLCHVAWGQVLSRCSGRTKVVFVTVLFGRMQTGADQAMGVFVNSLPFRIVLDDTPIIATVYDAHVLLASLMEHEHASLALAQRCSGLPPGVPLTSAMMNYRHNAELTYSEDIRFLGARERNNYPIALTVEDFGTALGLAVQVLSPIDPDRVCAYVEEALVSLVEALENTPNLPVRKLQILPQAERELLLKTWNDTDSVYGDEVCLHELFERQVDRTPSEVAIITDDKELTYQELNRLANQLGRRLLDQDVVPDMPIAICVDRSAAMIVGLLAILKAGGAYVPLDPDQPRERLARIIADADPTIILADRTGRKALGDVLGNRVVLDPNERFDDSTRNFHVADLTSRHLAYVLYTSGSTGWPKGVKTEHRALVNRFEWMQNTFALTTNDRVLCKTPIVFDVSAWEVFWTLLNGATLVIAPPGEHRDINALIDLIRRRNVTIAHFIPSMLMPLLNSESVENCRGLKYIICSGEALPSASIKLCQSKLPRTRLFNLYGPTEAAIDVTAWPCSPLYDHDPVPIGRPISNVKIYLLDERKEPVPLGAIGEIFIGGVAVARGYLNRPELTVQQFTPDPFVDGPTARVYKTGDLARYLPDGNLVFLGRKDRQLKVRGIRIEPGEIEVRLMEYPRVREAAVTLLHNEHHWRLVSYLVADNIDNAKLREHLSTSLPDYMIPVGFVHLEALPRLPNGKVDFLKLPVTEVDSAARGSYEEPVGPIEIALAEIWRDLTGVEKISRQDSFFALGGDSLLAIRMMERLRRLDLELTVRELFETPVLSTLARNLVKHKRVEVPTNLIDKNAKSISSEMLPLIDLTQDDIDKIIASVPGGVSNIQDIYGLAPLQDGILFHHLLNTDGDPYLITGQTVFADRPTLDRYLAVVGKIVDRHDILRTSFIWKTISVPAQVVWRHAALSITELELDSKNGPISDQLSQRFDPSRYQFDLTQAPLLRFVIVQDKVHNCWILLSLLHHMIGDHTTLDVLRSEVDAFLENRAEQLPPPEPFRILIAQARLGTSVQSHEQFFAEMLKDVTEPTLPFGLADVYQSGSRIVENHRMLPADLNLRLRAQAKRLNVSLASLCHLAWARVLSGITCLKRVVFLTVLFGRMRAGDGSDRIMGPFINSLPFRVDLEDTSLAVCARDTHLRLASLLEHEHASLALAQKCSGVPAGTPLSSALFNYRHNLNNPNSANQVIVAQERNNYPVTMSLEDFGTAIGVTAQVQLPIESERFCGYMERALTSLAETLETDSNAPVNRLQILSEAEREMLLESWNDTQSDYPDEICVHQLFEQQVERIPRAVALRFGDEDLTYSRLNFKANQLGRRLVELGVKEDKLVAICVEKSPAMIVGILAILKSGGAYVPLDPGYPKKLLEYILADADPVVVLADKTGRKALGDDLTSRIVLDPNDDFTGPDNNLHLNNVTSRNLAYVIYTSGSTGLPKGVMIEHRSVVNYSIFAIQRYGSVNGSLIASSIAFDLTVTALFPTLISGRILHIPPSNENLLGWTSTIIKNGNLSVKLTPSHLGLIQSQMIKDLGQCVNTLVLGGELPSRGLLEAWHTYAPATKIFNEYGPTEATVGCVVHEIEQPTVTNEFLLIGRPISNVRIYLLDDHHQPVPLGSVGEIFIGGHGVARGYFNRPELTAEKFPPDPFVDHPNSRMYKSGDLARYMAVGKLMFLGRNDEQIKIRGYRIEPREVESKILEHPAVREAVVIASGQSDKRLIAYVIADEIQPLSLRRHLRQFLPDHMIPTAFIKMDAFPLTANGKLDFQSLPEPDDDDFPHADYRPPNGPIEVALAEIWADILGVDKIGAEDSFFDLGGNSLLAVKMIQKAISCALPCSLNELFEQPSLSDFAHRITSESLTKGHDHAIPIRTGGTGQPLFFVPTGLGDHSYVFALARNVRTDCPIYALPWPWIESKNMEGLVEKMIAFIKAVQPVGPYRIAGYSAGGILAYAIAENLSKFDQVNFVGLIDVAPPNILRKLSAQKLFLEYLAQNVSSECSDNVAERLDKIDCQSSNFDVEKVLRLGVNLPGEFIALAWQRINLFTQAAKSYQPLNSSLNVYQFHSTETYHPRIGDRNISAEEIVDEWKKIGTIVRFVPIPGDHWTMMNDSYNRSHLGRAISEALLITG